MNAIKFVFAVVGIAVGIAVGLSLCDIAKTSDDKEEAREKEEWDKFFGH